MFPGWFAGNVVRILSFALAVCWWVQVMVVVLAPLVGLGWSGWFRGFDCVWCVVVFDLLATIGLGWLVYGGYFGVFGFGVGCGG